MNGLADGLQAGLWILGALAPLAAIALAYLLIVAVIDIPHRVRVAKLRRQDRRYGRPSSFDPTAWRR